MWSLAESVTYNWPDWTRPWLAPPRWSVPRCDVLTRPVDLTEVAASEPMEWPAPLAGLNLTTPPPPSVPWQGSIGWCVPMQRVDRRVMTQLAVSNPYGGTDVATGTTYKGGQGYSVPIPAPVAGFWGWEGFPTATAGGDRHWVGVEMDGTTHEAISFRPPTATAPAWCETYASFAPDGRPLHHITPGGAVWMGGKFRENFSWPRVAWSRGDQPHRLGLWLHDLGGGDGTQPWSFPAYGQTVRLSEKVYRELSWAADAEQLAFLTALRRHGAEIYDRGAQHWHASFATVAGAQWAGSTLGKLRIPVAALELVTADR